MIDYLRWAELTGLVVELTCIKAGTVNLNDGAKSRSVKANSIVAEVTGLSHACQPEAHP